jgi:hypothetical protein
MLGGAVELPMNLAVTHVIFLKPCSVATARRTICSGGLPAFARPSPFETRLTPLLRMRVGPHGEERVSASRTMKPLSQ